MEYIGKLLAELEAEEQPAQLIVKKHKSQWLAKIIDAKEGDVLLDSMGEWSLLSVDPDLTKALERLENKVLEGMVKYSLQPNED